MVSLQNMAAEAFLNIALFEAILLLVNLPAFLLGIRFEGNDASKRLWFEPSGRWIPLVWFILFILLALLYTFIPTESMEIPGLILGLAVLCASYPYYTLGLERLTGFSAIKLGLIGNGAIIFTTIVVGNGVAKISTDLAYFLFPIVVWTAYTSFVLLGRLRLEKEEEAVLNKVP